ncbi:hypothetical protein INR49_005526 [Caranx melampygus]|nr:hypothetical protein INR49_005526 [Caranx melampygus]
MMERKGGLARLDVGVLSPEQQEKLRQFKIKTRTDNEKYLRSHPEVELLVGDFLRDVLLKRPINIHEFAAANRPNMRPGQYQLNFKEMAKNMMMKCKNEGYQVPERMMLNTVFNNRMYMLQEVFDPMSDNQRTQVVKWAKEQIACNYFNCTTMRSSDPKSGPLEPCKPSMKWLNVEAMTMMGPYLSQLPPHEVDSSPKKRSAFQRATRMKPLLGKKFLERIQECFSNKDFEKHVDKLGPLACFYYDAPSMSPELSKNLLSQLDNCDNPRITQVKKRLVKSMISNSKDIQTLQDLGSSVTLLPSEQLSSLSRDDLKNILKNLGTNVQWTQRQMQALLKNQLGDEKCKELSGEELKELQSVAEGLPRCMLKQVKSQVILKDREALRNISRKMRKGQLKAMLQGLRGDMNPSELVQKLSGPLLRSISLNSLEKANITSLDQVENKMWSRPQAAYLAKKMQALKQLNFRRLHSVLQGITCKMIDKVADNDTKDMAEAVAETPQWLSNVQAGCAARKLFDTLEKERANYFKAITQEEMDKIPTLLLLYLPPSKVKDLPNTVCPVFFDKMEEANLSSLPLRSPSRPALTAKALQCLTNGANVSTLSFEDVSRLGQFLCELPPSQLRLMAPDVINKTLQDIASCQYIPRHHREDLIQLVKQTFGDPSDWSAETMEDLGPVLFLNDTTTSALPNKPWMKDVLYFLKSRLSHISDALRKKLFDLTTSSTSAAARRRREANSNSDKTPTVVTIEQLGMDNVFWTAAELDKITNATFIETVEILGDIPNYKADQLAVLRKKATEAFGPVSEITESEVRQMQCILRASLTPTCRGFPSLWTLWRISLNVAGLTHRDAVGSLDGVQCSLSVRQELKTVAVSAFGEPSTWTEAQVSDLGNIIAGLDADEFASLDSSVFSFLSISSIPLIPPNNFAALSVAQLEALGPDNAAVVTGEQQAALSEEQKAALQRAMDGSRSTPSKTTVSESGAPSLSVEGISAYLWRFEWRVMLVQNNP